MEDKKKYYCKFCNYSTDHACDWIKHSETDKHQRNGKKKIHKCNECEYESNSKWNMNIHLLSSHSTQEERKKSKFYCKDCDQVFFCKLYLDKHNSGKKHKNVIKANEILAEINAINV